MKILCTGGLGYIGSHTTIELINKGYDVVIVDNLFNSNTSVLSKIKKITGKDVKFYEKDVCDKNELEKIFAENQFDAVIHFAGYKAVGESVERPLAYYENNLISTFNVLEMMLKFNVKNIIFSSSATVYAPGQKMPLNETSKLEATNPYGRTKLFNEHILIDFQKANPNFNVILLRYFNPIGAHESGLVGENPNGIPNNLMPYICKVATGELDHLSIFGNDYDTKDGTGVRDYIHVVDLAQGHVKAVDKILKTKDFGVGIYNLGTGTGYSVLDIVNSFNKINGDLVKYEFAPRRQGDVAVCYADSTKAEKELGFKATKTLEEMCKSSYEFAKNNETIEFNNK